MMHKNYHPPQSLIFEYSQNLSATSLKALRESVQDFVDDDHIKVLGHPDCLRIAGHGAGN
jgi:hypothetical protein